jgi:hypothetical protein
MKSFLCGTIFGVVVATVGFSGIARIFDNGLEKVKATSTELAKEPAVVKEPTEPKGKQ